MRQQQTCLVKTLQRVKPAPPGAETSSGWTVLLAAVDHASVRTRITQMHTGSYVLEGSTQPSGRGRAGPGSVFQTPQCLYAYRIPERGRKPREHFLSLPLYRWGH